jgi:hypothetical protein
MIELLAWARAHPSLLSRPWLILGKGPSFARVREFDLAPYNLISLNHVVRELRVSVAHFADLEALEDCADSVVANCDWVLMPYRPHVKFRAAEQTLADLVLSVPVLGKLERLNRLVWYNLSTSPPVSDSPIIQAGPFGSEVVVNILAELGVKVVRTLGIDGGRSYSSTFRDLAGRTLLASGATSYDLQFVGIQRTVEKHGLDFGRLIEPIRIFVGTDESQRVAARVLEYSIRKNASRPVEFVYLDTIDVPLPASAANRPRTGFSFKRFAIPELCGHRGRAVYLDADMIVFGDIAQIWDLDMGPHSVMCTRQEDAPDAWHDHESFQPGRQMSVLLLDCAKLPWDSTAIVRGLDEGRYTYAQLMFDLCVVPMGEIAETIPPEWNSLERYNPPATKLLHYTVVPTQPWKSDNNPLGNLWMAWYAEAMAAGAVPVEEVERGIADGFLKPALAACLRGARVPEHPGSTAPVDPVAHWQSLDLEVRAARGETLMAQAQASALDHELRALRLELQKLLDSWTWRVGRLATGPARLAIKTLRMVMRKDVAVTPPDDALPVLYREMHAKGLFPGVAWRSIFETFAAAIPDLERRTILDFGCGPRGGLAEQLKPGQVVSYDPYVETYSKPPWNQSFDVVFSSDVLEHLPQREIEVFAANVFRCRPEFVFLNISTRPAHKTFSSGENVHVTVKPATWWQNTLGTFWSPAYDCRVLLEHPGECALLFTRRGVEK